MCKNIVAHCKVWLESE